MRTNAVIRIVIWALVLVALTGTLVLFLFPWLMRDPFVIASSGELYAEAVPSATEPPVETPVQVLPNEEKLALPADSISEIEIEWVAGNILIQPSDVDAITISESDIEDAKYAMVWKQKNNKLDIAFCEENLISGFGINLNADLKKDLYIYVPRNWACRSLEIDAASATVEIYDLTIRELDFDGASGTCDLENCNITDLDIDTASGDVRYSGSLETLDFDSASASFYGELSNTPSRIDMDGMSGSLDIALPEDAGFTVSMDGMSRHFSSDFDTTTRNGAHVHGNGHCRVNVDGMSTDVTIRKQAASAIDPTEETVVPCTEPNCTDVNCAVHHTQENCTDEDCSVHSHQEGHH